MQFFKKRNREGVEHDKKSNLDIPLLIVIVTLSIFGVLMVYDGSVIVAVRQGHDPNFYFIKQAMWTIMGFMAMYVFYRIDYHFLGKISFPLIIFSVFLLILVLIVNHDNDIKRWMDLGPFDLQPSEVAKFSLLIYLSSWLSKQRDQVGDLNEKIKFHFKHELLPFLLILGSVCGLILIEPDMDTTIMLGVTSFIVYFLSGNDRIHLIGSIAVGLLTTIMVTIATIAAKYRLSRLTNFIDFWRTGNIQNPLSEGYQFKQVLVAVASGGWFGLGFGQSRQKFLYLGETAFSDTIFAIVAEEFGLMGCILIVGLLAFVFYKGYKIAMKAPDKLGFLIAIAFTTWLVFQSILHIGSNVGMLPINGNTLPFISYGGSSTLINLGAIGVLLNISKHQKENTIERFERKERHENVVIKRLKKR